MPRGYCTATGELASPVTKKGSTGEFRFKAAKWRERDPVAAAKNRRLAAAGQRLWALENPDKVAANMRRARETQVFTKQYLARFGLKPKPRLKKQLTVEEKQRQAIMTASIKRIISDVVSDHPDMIRECIIDGLRAPAPRSYPYLALAAAYLDGRPEQKIEVNSTVTHITEDALQNLSLEELQQFRLLQMKLQAPKQLEGERENVIDVTPVEVASSPR